MEHNKDGGIFTLDHPPHGRWEVLVPWSVAIDGWWAETGRETSDRGELIDWMTRNQPDFADMALARIDKSRPSRTDDPRVTAKRVDGRT